MRLKLKYCGNHSLEDVRKTMHSRADYLGFIFTQKSRRAVSPLQAADWLDQAGPAGHKQIVGVFADDPMDLILKTARTVRIDVIQLHGGESPQYAAAIRKKTGIRVWKAIHHGASSLNEMRLYEGYVDGYVIDTKVAGQFGGTGIAFDWHQVPLYTEEARRQGKICLIAGGIRPENVGDLLRYGPEGIDISSGIESNFHKDSKQIRKIEEKVCGVYDQTAAD
ncbi:phosphoribosylanthranilate isomerase [Sporolactobacillus vineae]|uniref:phosphoribosylanthranilate isomerase n=1 Tax=Sporolactobacillus vineae TaxID=444463 RepID=UPI0002EBD7EB|nr:phosphoribosylanthranilate isomerase [Sporolactobacillus vineae]